LGGISEPKVTFIDIKIWNEMIGPNLMKDSRKMFVVNCVSMSGGEIYCNVKELISFAKGN
jgi:pyruvate-formate lyase-activating enzyme